MDSRSSGHHVAGSGLPILTARPAEDISTAFPLTSPSIRQLWLVLRDMSPVLSSFGHFHPVSNPFLFPCGSPLKPLSRLSTNPALTLLGDSAVPPPISHKQALITSPL